MAKRVFDFFCASVLLLVLWPVLLIIACAVKVTSSGPVIFKQERMGINCSTFVIFKFRTLVNGSGKPRDLVLKNDRRITRAGKFLRSTHLDELPQLWNILRGDMSMVGPRPTSINDAVQYIKEFPGYEKRFRVRPGLTGPSQIHDRMWRLKNRERFIEMDIAYSKKQSFLRDLRILFSTVFVVIRRQGI